jgi:signal transduction histidine kinase/ActR/RegA family two-component response regulator/HAMP domain-containing protein
MAPNGGATGGGGIHRARLRWERGTPWSRLRLRQKASVLVLSVAAVIGMLVTLIVILEHLDRGALVTAETARTTQVSLNRFSLALDDQRIAVSSYLLTHDPQALARCEVARQEAARDLRQLTDLAARDQADVRPLRKAADGWQAWADGAVNTTAGPPPAGEIDRGTRLFGVLEAQEHQLDRMLDGAATRATSVADLRSSFLGAVTPAVGFVLLGLLLFLGGLVIRSMLRPINQLAETARAISRGEAPDIPAVGRDDELGQLARALAAWREEATHRLDLANAVTAEKGQQARTLELLNQAATATSGVLEPALLGHILVGQVSELLGGAEAVLTWHHSGRGELRILVKAGTAPGPDEAAIPEGNVSEATIPGEPLLVQDYQAWSSASSSGLRSGIQSMAAVPLTIRGRRSGVLTAFTRGERRLDQHDLRVLALLAAQAAPALEAARLHAELLRALQDLTRTNEELALASRHKSDFVAGMSHELRTPLNAILGFSELLLDSDDQAIDPVRRTSFLRHIHNGGKHLLNLINDMLDLSKVEAGQMELRETIFDLAVSVSYAQATMSPLADKGGIELRSSCPAALLIRADEEKLGQVLLNLLANAIKFTPEGGRVTVEVRQELDRLVICVADTGIGIAKEDHERIFEEFQQLAAAGGPQPRGTGLGLTLTRRLVELHGGEIWVDSGPGEGSRFYIGLPVRLVEAQAAIDQPAEGPLVLVIEDNASAATLLVDMLLREGYRTSVLCEGRGVAEEAARLQPLAITLDILLPDLHGWDVLRALKSSPRTRDIPVIVVSVIDDRSRGIALGADEYLVKPVDRAALLAAVRRVRHLGGGAGASRATRHTLRK